MEQFFLAIQDHLEDHWVKFVTAAVLMLIGWFLGRWRANRDWQRKQFFGRVNISLNVLQDGWLRIRTIIEKSGSEVFLNAVAADTVAKAARKTTEQNPILPLPKDDYWYYLNAVLNEVAEKFAFGEMKQDLGLPATKDRYLICLTSETAGEVRTRKVRAMLIKKETLEKLPEEEPKFEAPNHRTRWKTLQFMATEYRKHPHQFLEMEIAI